MLMLVAVSTKAQISTNPIGIDLFDVESGRPMRSVPLSEDVFSQQVHREFIEQDLKISDYYRELVRPLAMFLGPDGKMLCLTLASDPFLHVLLDLETLTTKRLIHSHSPLKFVDSTTVLLGDILCDLNTGSQKRFR